jgi:hypothetical protein
MVDSIDKIKTRIRNLKQNANLSEEEIEKLAQEQSDKLEIIGSLTFVLPAEMEFATDLLNRYLAESSIESAAEKDTLRQLIDVEVLLERIKAVLNTEYSKANPSIPVQMLQQVTELNKQILELKEKLGLVKKEDANFINTWETLKKKALKYYEEHSGCNTVKCPYCQQFFHLLIDRTDYKEIKSTWFKNSILYNKKVFDLYHNKVITKQDVAEVLGVSEMYVEYIYENLYLKESVENDKQD